MTAKQRRELESFFYAYMDMDIRLEEVAEDVFRELNRGLDSIKKYNETNEYTVKGESENPHLGNIQVQNDLGDAESDWN